MVVWETVVEGLIVEGTLVERSVKGRLDKLLREWLESWKPVVVFMFR